MQSLLTAREFEVARLVALGNTNRAIAAALFVSPRTIENHLYSIYSKLSLRGRTQLALAMYHGLQSGAGADAA